MAQGNAVCHVLTSRLRWTAIVVHGEVRVDGPKETFFDALHVEATQGQEQAMQSNNNGGGSGGGQVEAIELPQAILDVIQNPHLDVDDI